MRRQIWEYLLWPSTKTTRASNTHQPRDRASSSRNTEPMYLPSITTRSSPAYITKFPFRYRSTTLFSAWLSIISLARYCPIPLLLVNWRQEMQRRNRQGRHQMEVLIQRLKISDKIISCVLRQITICKSLPKICDPSTKLGGSHINPHLRSLSVKDVLSQEWFEIISPASKWEGRKNVVQRSRHWWIWEQFWIHWNSKSLNPCLREIRRLWWVRHPDNSYPPPPPITEFPLLPPRLLIFAVIAKKQ